ncbi:MAG: 4Fe-4S ferredoxin [Thermoprotei archaeon]|nr:MAG: 4Fe-4S ferredoxin [Thermoprotei archaeon]
MGDVLSFNDKPMAPSEVYFLDYSKGYDILEGIKRLFREAGFGRVLKGKVAVKVHIGEMGNTTYLRPVFVRVALEALKEIGCDAFITETTTLYPKRRFTPEGCYEVAQLHGFTEKLGAPFIVADGEGQGVKVKVDRQVEGCELGEVEVAPAIAKADSLLLLVHAKGHLLAGFGGALKHLAMGCVTKASKAAQHAACGLKFNAELCNGCGKCVEACPFDALRLEDGRPMRDLAKCMHCNSCMFACPNGAWSWPEEGKAGFQVYLAHAAYAVANFFRGRLAVLSFVQDVTPLCDCATPAGRPLVPDVGVLASLDPVATDAAALDLIDVAASVTWHSARPPNFLSKVNGVDPKSHLRVAERLGVGSTLYRLITLEWR